MSINKKTGNFATPFSKAYWSYAFSEVKSVKKLMIAALLISLSVIISTIYIPVPAVIGTPRIYFSYLVNSLGSFIYGPVISLISGFVGDIIGCIVHPTGAYFPGYTLTSMLGALVYALFFYKSKLTILRIVLCKIVVNLFINVALNSLWDSIILGKGYIALAVGRIAKNVIMLPIEVILIVIFFTCMIPILKKQKIIDYSPFEKRIKLI